VIIFEAVPASAHYRRRWVALCVVCLGMTMNVLDQTIVNVALPTIQRSLHFSQVSLAWVVDGYLITFGGFLLLAGRLGDLVGRKKTFLVGVSVFTASSALCGLATSQAMLIAARFAQGAGAAFSASVVLAIIVGEFPDPAERIRAMNAYVLVTVAGGSLGLLLGGVLTQALSWHWIFMINVPVGVATLIAGSLLLDESEGLGIHAGLDIAGAVLSTGGLMLGIYAVVTSTQYGWVSRHTLTLGLAAVVLLGSFFFLETRIATPLMPIRVLRSRGLGSSCLVRALMVVGMFGTFYLGALYLQHLLGYGPLATGLAFLPQTLTVAVMSLGPSARLIKILHHKPMALLGFASIFSGLVLFALVTPHTAYFPQVFFALLLIGMGGAMAFTPLLTIGVSNIPAADAGLGSGLINVSQQVSAAVAVAVLSVVSANRTHALLAAGHSPTHALAGGYRLGFVVGAGCAAAGAVVCALLVPSPSPTQTAPADLAPVVESVDI
jgi:EmrB/QacA subfamily drug resistance transporter